MGLFSAPATSIAAIIAVALTGKPAVEGTTLAPPLPPGLGHDIPSRSRIANSVLRAGSSCRPRGRAVPSAAAFSKAIPYCSRNHFCAAFEVAA